MWWEALELKGFHLSRSKIDDMESKFNIIIWKWKLESILYQRSQVFDILEQLYKAMERLIGMSRIEFRLGGWNGEMPRGSFVIIKYLISLKGSSTKWL